MIKRFIRNFQYALNSREHSLFNHLLPEEKRQRIAAFSAQFDTFVETGTYLGHTAEAMSSFFKKVYTIEIHEGLFKDAEDRLTRQQNIRCFLGNSAQILPAIVDEIKGPAIFWLDAHYSGPKTGRTQIADCPIKQELEAIFESDCKEHLILIDDARLFVGKKSYPRIGDLWKFVRKNSSYSMTIREDIIRLARDPERY